MSYQAIGKPKVDSICQQFDRMCNTLANASSTENKGLVVTGLPQPVQEQGR